MKTPKRIEPLVEDGLAALPSTRAESLDVLHAADEAARRYARTAISRLN